MKYAKSENNKKNHVNNTGNRFKRNIRSTKPTALK